MERAVTRVLLGLLLLLLKISESQLPSKRTYHPIRDDVPHIRCETCQKGVRAAYRHVPGLRDTSKKVGRYIVAGAL